MKHLTILFFLFLSAGTYAQTSIGTTTPDPSAQLEVSSTTKGFLPPRMNAAQRDDIVSPATGLVVYNTTANVLEYKTASGWVSYQDNPDGTTAGEMQYWDGSAWVTIVPGTEGQILTLASGLPTWAGSTSTTFYQDLDGDGYGDVNSTVASVLRPFGYVADNTDCDDSDVAINSETVWYVDGDGDGYVGTDVVSCLRPINGFLLNELSGPGTDDCDDSDASINPSIFEFPNDGVDNNCDGEVDNIVIGSFVGGGIVFYLADTPTDLDGDGDLDIGLVCAIEDQGIKPWRNLVAIQTGANETGIGYGASNTRLIIEMQGDTSTDYAAGFASAYNGGGFTDWFLPSIDELVEMNNNETIINDRSVVNGGSAFESGFRWSSSQDSDDRRVWNMSFGFNCSTCNGVQIKNSSNTYNVRAIRAF